MHPCETRPLEKNTSERLRTMLWEAQYDATKTGILFGVVFLTVGLHYGWLIEPLFGQVAWFHAIHGHFCYVPILMASAWYGLRGGISMALLISVAITPFLLNQSLDASALAKEIAEIVLYFGFGILGGGLIDRENRARELAEKLRLDLERSYQLSLAGQMAAGVAHEIKNPLASILGAVEILTDTRIPDAEKQEFREIILHEVRRVDATVTQFLELARPAHTVLSPVDLGQIVDGCVRQMASQAAELNVSIVTDIPAKALVNADTDRLHQILLNLLINALDACAPGGEVSVSILENESRSHMQLILRDNGTGMAPGVRDHIFEPFFTTKATGSGLGLAIIKSIMEQHHGRVTVESIEGKGTTMTLHFPMRTNEED